MTGPASAAAAPSTEPESSVTAEKSVGRPVGRPVGEGSVSVAGRQVAYTEYGDPAGRPVVLLHGTPGTSRLGGLFAPAASEAGLRVLAIDRPGYGDSEPWPERSLSDIGRVVVAVLDTAGADTAGVIGFSGGGPHALAVAATHPERVTSVDVISGSTPPAVGGTPALQRLLSGMAATTPGLFRGLFSLQSWIADRLSPSVFLSQYTDREIESFEAGVVELLTAEFVEAVGGGRPGVATEFRLLGADWGFAVEGIDRPVRFWHGTRDANVPIASVRQLSRRVPESTVRAVEGDHLSVVLDCRSQVLAFHSE